MNKASGNDSNGYGRYNVDPKHRWYSPTDNTLKYKSGRSPYEKCRKYQELRLLSGKMIKVKAAICIPLISRLVFAETEKQKSNIEKLKSEIFSIVDKLEISLVKNIYGKDLK